MASERTATIQPSEKSNGLKVEAFVFDLDGVLTDTAELHYLAWKELADELGITFTRVQNEALRGVSRRESLERLLQGRPVSDDQAQELMDRKNRRYQEMLERLTPSNVLPGVSALLDELRAQGVRVVVASASRNARRILELVQLESHIDALVDGGSVARTKPAPDLFLHAAATVGASPERCVVVEDAAAGIAAGRAAGMWTVGLGPYERVGLADLVYPSLADVQLARLLERLAAGGQWRIRETALEVQRMPAQESIFTVGNGFLGTRGTLEEGAAGRPPVTLIAGVYDDTEVGKTELVNAPSWLDLRLTLAGEPLALDKGTILEWERTLDMRTGTLARRVLWRNPAGQTVLLEWERCASLADPHLVGLRCRIRSLDFAGEVQVQAELNSRVDNEGRAHWQDVDRGAEQWEIYLHTRTQQTQIEVAAAAALQVDSPHSDVVGIDDGNQPSQTRRFTLAAGEEATVTKLVSIWTSREDPAPLAAARRSLHQATAAGYAGLRAPSDARWEKAWHDSNICIAGDDRADRAVRFNLFHLLIAAPWHDERISIPARTLSGFGYRGHIFWDTDTFIIPFFAWTQPQVARNLLLYRYHTLPGARQKARDWGYPGAAFAWESAATGEETTPTWVTGPTGQQLRVWCGDIELHITADVAHALWEYWQITGDDDFLRDYGVEILAETARFWAARLEYDQEADRYELNDVIGPDEYHEHVNNNAFTNAMVRWHLGVAAESWSWLGRVAPERARALAERLGLSDQEVARWPQIAERVYIPYDAEKGLLEQFSSFFGLAEVDWPAFRERTKAMDVVLGHEGIQHVQVLKQPDVLMLAYLLGHNYSDEEKQALWAYYEPRTDHAYGSSLGPAIHAALGTRLGFVEHSYGRFLQAALMDLENLRGNAGDGIHAASAGGVWQAVVLGFAGLSRDNGGLDFRPALPEGWERLSFRIQYHGRSYQVDLPGKAVGEEAFAAAALLAGATPGESPLSR